MKEQRFFYVPEAATASELPSEELAHALRVLRLKAGDEMMLIDGAGTFHQAQVTETSNHRCLYRITAHLPQPRQWPGHLHLAIAPTKTPDRMEWLTEKATEIGLDELTFLECQFSERRTIKTQRLEKIVISAMKQSRKAWKPQLNEMTAFSQFISQPRPGRKYIAHCYDEVPRTHLFQELSAPSTSDGDDITVLIGPEGDFSIGEVRMAVDAGYTSVHLGDSRLRTETAGLAAVMMMQLRNPKNT